MRRPTLAALPLILGPAEHCVLLLRQPVRLEHAGSRSARPRPGCVPNSLLRRCCPTAAILPRLHDTLGTAVGRVSQDWLDNRLETGPERPIGLSPGQSCGRSAFPLSLGLYTSQPDRSAVSSDSGSTVRRSD